MYNLNHPSHYKILLLPIINYVLNYFDFILYILENVGYRDSKIPHVVYQFLKLLGS